jgi:hypothetical protein
MAGRDWEKDWFKFKPVASGKWGGDEEYKSKSAAVGTGSYDRHMSRCQYCNVEVDSYEIIGGACEECYDTIFK